MKRLWTDLGRVRFSTRELFLACLMACTLSDCLAAGCASRVSHVTNLPAGVTEQQAKNYDTAVAGLHKVATVTSTLRQAVIALRATGPNNESLIDDKSYGEIITAIARIDQAQLAASAYLRDAPEYIADPQKQKIGEIFGSVTEQIQALNVAGATGIKNQASLTRINNLIAELYSVVKVILALTQ